MRLYMDHSSKGQGRAVPIHRVTVAPAADKSPKVACPSEWVDADNRPVEFTLEFVHGALDTTASGIPDSVAKYCLDRGLARKNRPVLLGAY